MKIFSVLWLFVFLLVGCGTEVIYEQSTAETTVEEKNHDNNKGYTVETKGQEDQREAENVEQEITKLEIEKKHKDAETEAKETVLDKNLPWNGTWVREGHMAGAELLIEKQNEEGFQFIISAFNGANIGEIGGLATFLDEGDTAEFIPIEIPDCVVIMSKTDNGIHVETTWECGGFAGMGVGFDGNFTFDDGIEQKVTLSSIGFLPLEVDIKIQDLLKNDYPELVERMQIISEQEDMDGLQSTVISGAVRGLYSIMEAIVMYDELGHVWVAILVEDGVMYYSNHLDYQNIVPQTIKNWKSNFEDVPVIMMP